MFFGINKYALMGAAAIIGLGTIYHLYTVNRYNAQLLVKNNEIVSLTKDKEKLIASNESLEVQMSFQKEANNQMLAEIQLLKDSDAKKEEQLQTTKQEIADTAAKVAKYMESDNPAYAESAIILANKQLDCRIKHLGQNGKCVMGEWRPN